MTELHASLELYREQLRDAIDRDLRGHARAHPGRRRPRLRLAIPAGLGIAAAGAAAIVAFTGGASVQSADAAILHRVADALTPPAGSILHERAMVTAPGQAAQRYELWQRTSAPYGYRVIKWGHEGTGRDSAAPNDPAATLSALVRSGKATVQEVTFDGVPAYRLTVTDAPTVWLDGTAYVRQSDYHPLEIDTPGGGGESIRYQVYEYLPATAANVALLGPGH
jgi:hypothetical protein